MSHNLTDLRRFCVVLYAIMVAGSVLFHRFDVTFSVALGGAVAFINLRFLERFLNTVLRNTDSPSAARFLMMLSFYTRFDALAVALYICAAAGWINFAALAFGLSLTALSIFTWFLAFGRRSLGEDYGRAC